MNGVLVAALQTVMMNGRRFHRREQYAMWYWERGHICFGAFGNLRSKEEKSNSSGCRVAITIANTGCQFCSLKSV